LQYAQAVLLSSTEISPVNETSGFLKQLIDFGFG
jgi:hypothetical protein